MIGDGDKMLEIDIDDLIQNARSDGKITKQDRAKWIKQVIDHPGKSLAIKELAGIIGASYHKVQKDWKRHKIADALKRGTDRSRCRVDISKQGAIDYIIEFEGTDDYEDPRQRKLPFFD